MRGGGLDLGTSVGTVANDVFARLGHALLGITSPGSL